MGKAVANLMAHKLLQDGERAPAAGKPRLPRGVNHKTYLFKSQKRSVGAILRAARTGAGRGGSGEWSLRAVALRTGVNVSLLSQIETGKRRPAADDLINLADALGLDREELLVRAGYLPESALGNRGAANLTARERALIQRLRKNARLRAVVEQLIELFD